MQLLLLHHQILLHIHVQYILVKINQVRRRRKRTGREKIKKKNCIDLVLLVYLGTTGAFAFHPGGTYFYTKSGGVFQGWLGNADTNTNNDFDLVLYTFVHNQWI